MQTAASDAAVHHAFIVHRLHHVAVDAVHGAFL
jgi:hypothetical protein